MKFVFIAKHRNIWPVAWLFILADSRQNQRQEIVSDFVSDGLKVR
jgi:hypothetical protein